MKFKEKTSPNWIKSSGTGYVQSKSFWNIAGTKIHTHRVHVAGDAASCDSLATAYETTPCWPTSPLVVQTFSTAPKPQEHKGKGNRKGHPHLPRWDDASKYCLHRQDGCSPDSWRRLPTVIFDAWWLSINSSNTTTTTATPFIFLKKKKGRMSPMVWRYM